MIPHLPSPMRMMSPTFFSRFRNAQFAAASGLLSGPAFAADAATVQPTNWNAILIFLAFVVVTLGITYWAAQHTRTTKDFYAAGGGVTGLQNGLAIAGDYMSAASFLGIVALVYSFGYYGLIYSIGFLVGWPFIMFLMAEPLRNLGRFTFADVVSYRLQATPIRAMAATGTLVVVALYLIAQMVGAGQLIELLFGLPYLWAVAQELPVELKYRLTAHLPADLRCRMNLYSGYSGAEKVA